MLFNSYIFILLFLPIALTGYFLLNKTGQTNIALAFLLGMSLWFYGYSNPAYLALLSGSIVLNYLLHRGLMKNRSKALLTAGVVLNLGILFYFKYYDFFVENLNVVFGSDFMLKKIVLPLGISFFTFQQISLVADTYKGETRQYDFLEYAVYVSFFPQLVAGPIVSHNQLIPQLRDPEKKSFSVMDFQKGLFLFCVGLTKKLLLADTFGKAVDWSFEHIFMLDSGNGILTVAFYAFQLYFDFSGYCDMARGLGYMFRLELPENFDSPYKSAGIIEFWRRWHMTLGAFFTKYVYIPLGGSRKGKAKTIRNSLVVFFLSGLWHGAAWTYVVWGLTHGVGYVADYLGKPVLQKIPRWLRVAITFAYVSLALMIFRAGSMAEALSVYKAIFTGGFGALLPEMGTLFESEVSVWIMTKLGFPRMNWGLCIMELLYLLLGAVLIFGCKSSHELAEKKPSPMSAVALSLLFVFCVLNMSQVVTFLYFNF